MGNPPQIGITIYSPSGKVKAKGSTGNLETCLWFWTFCFLKSCGRYLTLRCFYHIPGSILNFTASLMLSLNLKCYLVFKGWKTAHLILKLFIVPSATCSCTASSQIGHCQIQILWNLLRQNLTKFLCNLEMLTFKW